MRKRLAFYEIPDGSQLYQEVVTTDSGRKQLEEPIRQWCAYELIRAYGIPLQQLEFERCVRVGSKTYRIDILITENSRPWCVVECKQRDFKKHEEALGQAISYADAREVCAPFVLYTNGNEWQVRRKINGEWVIVADLPVDIDIDGERDLYSILDSIQELEPLLYKLDEPVAGEEAKLFLSKMQEFFCGWNFFTDSMSESLVHGLDNLLRVLSSDCEHPDYKYGKLSVARRHWDRYRQFIRSSSEFPDIYDDERFRSQFAKMHHHLGDLISNRKNDKSIDGLLIRLSMALLDYGMNMDKQQWVFPPMSAGVHHALRDFLDYVLLVKLNTRIPSSEQHGYMQEIKNCCSRSWDVESDTPKLTGFQFVCLWLRSWFRK